MNVVPNLGVTLIPVFFWANSSPRKLFGHFLAPGMIFLLLSYKGGHVNLNEYLRPRPDYQQSTVVWIFPVPVWRHIIRRNSRFQKKFRPLKIQTQWFESLHAFKYNFCECEWVNLENETIQSATSRTGKIVGTSSFLARNIAGIQATRTVWSRTTPNKISSTIDDHFVHFDACRHSSIVAVGYSKSSSRPPSSTVGYKVYSQEHNSTFSISYLLSSLSTPRGLRSRCKPVTKL